MQGEEDGIGLVWWVAAIGIASLALAVLLAVFLPGEAPPTPPY